MEFVNSGKISMAKVYIHPIWADIHSHYINNNLSILYIYNIESGQEFVINIGNIDNHTTTLNNLTFEFGEAYTFDKKSLMSLIQFPNMYDAGLMKYLQINETLKENQTPCHSFFYRKFNRLKNVNNIIPTYKHIESIRKTKDEFLSFYNVDMVMDVKKFDNFYINSLSHIEQNGFYTKDGIEWTQYNPYTITSRPSNTFGGINYAALNKDDGTRSRFVSRFDGGSFDADASDAAEGADGRDAADDAAGLGNSTSNFSDDESGYYGDYEEFDAPINYSTSGNVDPGLQQGNIGIATSPPSDLTDGGSDLDAGGYGIGLDTLSRLGIVGPDAPPDGGILGNYLDPDQEDDEEAKVGQYRQSTFLDNLFAKTALGRAVGVPDDAKEKGVFVADKDLGMRPDYDKDDVKTDQARNNLGNVLTQVAQQARQEAEDKIGDRGMAPMNEKESEEMSPDKAAKDAVSKAAAGMVDNYKEYADLGSPYGDLGALGFIAPGGTALSGLSALANAARDFFGVVGGGTINGRDVHVHTDGTISFVSPEDEPGYQNTDNDSGNDQLPRRRIAQAPAPVAASTTATEEPKTGMAALLARRQPVANRLDTLTDLQEKFQKIYNRPFRTV